MTTRAATNVGSGMDAIVVTSSSAGPPTKTNQAKRTRPRERS